MLFTNRKYSGVVGERLVKKIVDETGIENAVIIGKEGINDTYLNSNKDIVRHYDLDKLHIPFSFSDAEIKEVLIEFRKQIKQSSPDIKTKSNNLKYDYSHISKTEKNKKNKLSEDYFNDIILGSSLQYFDDIGSFLSDPINEILKDYYCDTVAELNEVITLKRNNFDAFEELFRFIYKLVCDGSEKILRNKRYVSVFLHYMYVQCEIGKK